MAFNFLGTLTKDDLNTLRSFLTGELDTVTDEINYLRIQKDNLSQTKFKLIEADSSLGGDTINSIKQTQLPKIKIIPEQDDRVVATLIAKVKKPFIPHIKYKRERLEYKILKIVDAIEQVTENMDRKAIAKTQTTALLNQVESYFNSTNQTTLFKTEVDKQNLETTGVA